VYLVWTTIRDISGLFIIFMLLYASFMMILDMQSKATGSVANLIKNIVIAGILINFSFFIVSVLIDASNIVSLALYKGIVGAPPASQSLNIGAMTQGFVDGSDVNLGNVFLNHLAPQAFYNIKLGDPQSSTPDFLKTIVQGIVGTVVMFTVSMSFLLASAAFVVRLVLLIILLAFSPVWFAAMIFPALKEKADHFTSTLKAQLIFMPVYLLLLYGSIEILTKSTIFVASGYQPSVGSGATGWLMGYVTLAVNDFFVIFLLNIPLVTAFSFASKGLGADWMKGAANKFGAENIWKNFGSQAGSRTLGRAAYWADTKATPWLASKSSIAGTLSSKAFSGISGAGFGVKKGGYEDRLKAKKEAQEKLHEKVGRVNRSDYATEAEFETARDAARGYQEKYRANLPWKNSVMGFMLDNRANKQSQRGLYDEHGAEKDLDRLLGLKTDRDGNKIAADKSERSKESLEYAYLKKRAAEGGDTVTNAEKTRLAELKEIEHELIAANKRGGKSKGKKDIEAAINRIAAEAAKAGGSDSKPKSDTGSAPKTP
jgi:hypothetical protein